MLPYQHGLPRTLTPHSCSRANQDEDRSMQETLFLLRHRGCRGHGPSHPLSALPSAGGGEERDRTLPSLLLTSSFIFDNRDKIPFGTSDR